jgi:hypothetical protein
MTIRALPLLALLLAAVPASAQPVEHAFLIVIDGLRASEAFDDPQREFVGALADELAPQGSLLTYMEVRAQTLTLPAHQVLVTGNYADYANLGAYEGRENFTPRTPTLFDAYRRHTGAAADSCWVVSNTYLVGEDTDHSLMPGFGPETGAQVVTDYSYTLSDAWVWDNVAAAMDDNEVSLMLVNLHEVDRDGHTEDWDAYTASATEASNAIVAFWEQLQADPTYAGNTLLMVTTDHGRHLDGVEVGWRSHGCQCAGCRQVFLLAVGPGVRAGHTSDVSCSFLDVAPTVAHLMDVPFPYHRGRILTEILEDGDQVDPGPGGSFHPRVVGSAELLVRTSERQDTALGDEEGAHRVAVELSTDLGETWDTTVVEGGSAVQHSPVAWTDGEVVLTGWLEVLARGDYWFSRVRRLGLGAGEWEEVFYEPMIGASTPVGNLAFVADVDESAVWLLENNALNERIRTWSSEDLGSTWSEDFDMWQNPRYFPRDLTHATVGDSWLAVFSAHSVGPPGLLEPNDNTEIYWIRSHDGGVTWSEEIAVTHDHAPSIQPALTVGDDGVVHLVWADRADGSFQIQYARSTDDGVTFSIPVALTTGSIGAWEPAVAVDGERAYVTWSQYDAEDRATVHLAALEEDSLVEERVLSDAARVSRTPHLLPLGDCTSLVTWSSSDLQGPWELESQRVATAGIPASGASGTVEPHEIDAGDSVDLKVTLTLTFGEDDRGFDRLHVRAPDGVSLDGEADLEVDGDLVHGTITWDEDGLWIEASEVIADAQASVALWLGADAGGEAAGPAPLEIELRRGGEPCSTAVEGALELTVVAPSDDDTDDDDDDSTPTESDPDPGSCECSANSTGTFGWSTIFLTWMIALRRCRGRS